MNLEQLDYEYAKLGNYKTKDLDKLNKKLIKEKTDVSFLKDIVKSNDKYHRTFFQVSLGQIKELEKQLDFIEENHLLLNDWWHVDQLNQFIKKQNFKESFNRAKKYVTSSHPFLRCWGYVIFIGSLYKDEQNFNAITSLFKNDDEYYVIMAEAWLISFLAIAHPEKTINYLKNCNLNYSIVGRAIQKTCDSYRVSDEYKAKFKQIRLLYK